MKEMIIKNFFKHPTLISRLLCQCDIVHPHTNIHQNYIYLVKLLLKLVNINMARREFCAKTRRNICMSLARSYKFEVSVRGLACDAINRICHVLVVGL